MAPGAGRGHAGGMNDTQHPGERPDATAGGPTEEPTRGSTEREGPRVTRSEVADLGRLRRTVHDRHVAGVAGGLGRHLDVDPLLLRVAFVVLVFFGGSGLLLYLAVWLLVPEEGTERAAIELDARSRRLGLLVAGGLAVLLALGDTWNGWGFPWPLALVAVVVFVLVARRRDPRSQPAPAAPTDGSTTGPAAGPAGPAGPTEPAGPTGYYWAPPPSGTATTPPEWAGPPAGPPPDPRRRGPVLFWAVLALAVLAAGVLGLVDVSGYDVPSAAYPALALGITGLALVTGAWWGRAGGLIALGLLLLPVLAATTLVDHYEHERRHAPTEAADLREEHFLPAADLVVDLTEIRDPDELDGRTLRLGVGTGRIEVLLPADVDARVRAEVGGPGRAEVLGRESEGSGNTVLTGTHDGGAEAPEIDLETWMGAGEVVVRVEEE